MSRERQSPNRPLVAVAQCLLLLALLAALACVLRAQQPANSPPSVDNQAGAKNNSTAATPVLPRGKKLVLKDGSFELVREYEVDGDRVRYYNLDSSQWEVMPTTLVDWDATKKLEAQQAQSDAVLVERAHQQEQERRLMPLDIDASLEVAKGVFLPAGEGLFVFDGNTVVPLAQAETDTSIAKKRVLEQVLIPVPVVPSRHNISIPRSRAKLRVRSRQPEFYMRTTDDRSPQMELIRAKVHSDSREIEHLDELFGDKAYTRATLPMQRWQVAQGVYRFTLGEPLEPGEYAIAEMVEGQGMSLYVWDFGVDENPVPAGAMVK